MQYDRDESGTLNPLPNPSIDTGAGLERLAAVLQGVESNYDTDLFLPILDAAGTVAKVPYGSSPEQDTSLRVIADHLRSVTFLLADGVIPGNEGRSYVLRRILRRAVRHGMRLGLEEPFLHRLVPVLGEVMGDAYPELAATREASVATIRTEEEKFLSTLAAGSRQVQEEIEAARAKGLAVLPGERAFWLYETHGLPVETIAEIAEEERMGFDRERLRRGPPAPAGALPPERRRGQEAPRRADPDGARGGSRRDPLRGLRAPRAPGRPGAPAGQGGGRPRARRGDPGGRRIRHGGARRDRLLRRVRRPGGRRRDDHLGREAAPG